MGILPKFRLQILLVSIFLAATILSGCRTVLKPGAYLATETVRDQNTSSSQRKVALDIRSAEHKTYRVTRLVQNQKPREVNLYFASKDELHVTGSWSPLSSSVYVLKKYTSIFPRMICFKTSYPSPETLHLCVSSERLFFSYENKQSQSFYEITAETYYPVPEIEIESPVTMTFEEAMKLGLNQNTDLQLRANEILQVTESAKMAYLNLIPHLSANVIWNMVPNYITFIATLQNVAPFLLPDRWLDAKIAKTQSRASEVLYSIVQLNFVSSLEELSIHLQRDLAILKNLEDFLEETREFQSRLHSEIGLLSKRKKSRFEEMVEHAQKALTSDIADIKRLINADRYALSRVLGYQSLQTVQNIEYPFLDENIGLFEEEDPHTNATLATQSSPEVKQLEILGEIKQIEKIKSLFVWINPTGNSNQGLGPSMLASQKQQNLRLQHIQLERKKLANTVYQNSFELIESYNESLHSYETVSTELSQDTFSWEDEKEKKKGSHRKLRDRVERHIGTLIAAPTLRANVLIARAKKDRYLLQGACSQIISSFSQ